MQFVARQSPLDQPGHATIDFHPGTTYTMPLQDLERLRACVDVAIEIAKANDGQPAVAAAPAS